MNDQQQNQAYSSSQPHLRDAQGAFRTFRNQYAVIRVSGPDALRFMQGQFTCDLAEVTDRQSRLGACCTPKGRMLAMFRLARVGDEFWLRLPRELVQPLLDHLKKFMVFFKTQMALDESLSVLGVVAPDPLQASLSEWPQDINAMTGNAEQVCIRVPGEPARYEIWGPRNTLESLGLQLGCPVQPEASWDLSDILAGMGEVFSSTREEFIPQMLNLQSLGGISFKKGCYTGQEIVARMQYLGTLKKRMYIVQGNLPTSPEPGVSIEDESGAGLGTLVRCQATADAGIQALAVLAQESLTAGIKLFLPMGEQKYPLEWREVPYPVLTISNERKKL